MDRKELLKLSIKLDCSIDQLFTMANVPQYFYRNFNIPKRKGGTRSISAPSIALLKVQRNIKIHYLKDEFLEPPATAYRPNKSIVDNAFPHLNCKHLLKIDIENFFGSIEIGRVKNLFETIVDDSQIALLLAQLTTFDRVLPQGAATSPSISNMVARNLDLRILGLSNHLGWKYTRYSDDISLSGDKRFTKKNLEQLKEIIAGEGFILCNEKTKFISSSKKIITGIAINGQELNVPKAYRRELKANIFRLYRGIRSDGLESIEDPIIFERLKGKLNHWKMVSPNNLHREKLEAKLNEAYVLFNDMISG